MEEEIKRHAAMDLSKDTAPSASDELPDCVVVPDGGGCALPSVSSSSSSEPQTAGTAKKRKTRKLRAANLRKTSLDTVDEDEETELGGLYPKKSKVTRPRSSIEAEEVAEIFSSDEESTVPMEEEWYPTMDCKRKRVLTEKAKQTKRFWRLAVVDLIDHDRSCYCCGKPFPQ